MAISGTDLALTTCRLGAARVGAFRLGFAPCFVKGVGAVEPGEYGWDEIQPPTTQWTLLTENCVCGQRYIAAFSNTTCPTVNQVVMFTDESTPAAEITFWYWDFGDGSTSNDQNPTHQYAAAGIYTVTLYISGGRGSASTTGTITVMEVVATADDSTPNSNQIITMTPTVSGGTAPFTYIWDFGLYFPESLNTDLYGSWNLGEATGSPRLVGGGVSILHNLFEVGGAVPNDTGRLNLLGAASTEADTFALKKTGLAPTIAMADGLTISFWFKWPTAPSVNPDSMLFLENAATPGADPYLHVLRYYNSDFLTAAFAWGGGANFIQIPTPRLGDLDVDEWHLFVLTYDPATGVLTGMVDDGCFLSATEWTALPLPALKLSATVPGASLAAANAITFDTLTLLKAFNGNFVNFEGTIERLEIHKTVLTAAQIARKWYRSDEENAQYAYGNGGDKTINVAVTESGGCTATDSVVVTVAGGGA